MEIECNVNSNFSGAIWENTCTQTLGITCARDLNTFHTCIHSIHLKACFCSFNYDRNWDKKRKLSLPNVDVECFKRFFTRSRFNKPRTSTTKLNLREIKQDKWMGMVRTCSQESWLFHSIGVDTRRSKGERETQDQGLSRKRETRHGGRVGM